MTEQQHPLSWPPSWPRSVTRERARFSRRASGGYGWQAAVTLAQARERLELELTRLRARTWLLSTNVVLRLDGYPRSGQGEPSDPGVALYFDVGGTPYCLACDRWDRVADNVCALAKHIEAMRGMDRWGVGSLEQAFRGYAALPARGETSTGGDWRALLGLAPTEVDAGVIRTAIKQARRDAHPDAHGGDRARWDAIAPAIEAAQAFAAGVTNG